MSITTTIDTKDFECVVCKNVMYNPYILSCSHRLCYDCIIHLSLESKSISMSCPTCRKPFYSNNISKDTFMINLMKNMEIDSPCEKKVLYKNLETHQKSCVECHYILLKQHQDLLYKTILKTFTPTPAPLSRPTNNSQILLDFLMPYSNNN